jgi:iron-sulfur cluster repair protein YtfE (RIC family)
MHCAGGMMNQGSTPITVTEGLTADHVRLDELFDQACDHVGLGDYERACTAFGDFAKGLGHHIAVEERFLFPIFDARVVAGGPTNVMRHEHRRIEQLLALADASLRASDPVTFATEAAELAAILRAHNLKEERILYPHTDAVIQDGEGADIVAILQRG